MTDAELLAALSQDLTPEELAALTADVSLEQLFRVNDLIDAS